MKLVLVWGAEKVNRSLCSGARGGAVAVGPGLCSKCAATIDFPFTMAFQPIVDVRARKILAHEALVRGAAGEGAAGVLSRVDDGNRHAFDQLCRVRAIDLAARLDRGVKVSVNFMPNAVYRPETCVASTLEAARRNVLPFDHIIFEVTEEERVADHARLRDILAEYRRRGFRMAIDDFGAGYSGLALLVEFQPDYVKIDMNLLRGLDHDRVRRVVVSRTMELCRDLGATPIAEGVETEAEMAVLLDLGVDLMQGYLFARPAFERILTTAEVNFPDDRRSRVEISLPAA